MHICLRAYDRSYLICYHLAIFSLGVLRCRAEELNWFRLWKKIRFYEGLKVVLLAIISIWYDARRRDVKNRVAKLSFNLRLTVPLLWLTYSRDSITRNSHKLEKSVSIFYLFTYLFSVVVVVVGCVVFKVYRFSSVVGCSFITLSGKAPQYPPNVSPIPYTSSWFLLSRHEFITLFSDESWTTNIMLLPDSVLLTMLKLYLFRYVSAWLV